MTASEHPDAISLPHTSANARFDRLFQGRPKPPQPKQGEIHFAEEEIQAQQKKLQSPKIITPPVAPTDDSTEIKISTSSKIQNASTKHSSYNVEAERDPAIGGRSQTIEYLPYGKIGADRSDVATDREDPAEPVADTNAEVSGKYCLFQQVAKFPYRYLSDPADLVSPVFFAYEKIFQRGFSLCYLLPPSRISETPLLLVPHAEVKSLTDDIAKTFDIEVDVPPYPFTLTFYKDTTPQPVYLGKVQQRDDVTALSDSIPAASPGHGECPAGADQTVRATFSAFSDKIQQVLDSIKKHARSSKKQKANRRAVTHTIDNTNKLNRLQRHLGLKPRTTISNSQASDSGFPQAETRQDATTLAPLMLTEPAPFDFEQLPVMISIDVETWEEDHNLITEVGISSLDTKDIIRLAPGVAACGWISKIRSRHFRIKKREHLVNQKFVQGNPTCFRFGQSEFITIEGAPGVVDSCFEHPFSAGFECSEPIEFGEGGIRVHEVQTSEDDAAKIGPTSFTANGHGNSSDSDPGADPPARRNVLLVGHDLQGDLDYLAVLGSRIFGTPTASSTDKATNASQNRDAILASILGSLDTAVLYKHHTKASQPTKLASMCNNLGITPWYTHNAGNDARYTLECLIKLAIKARQDDDAASAAARADANNATSAVNGPLESEAQEQSDQEFGTIQERIDKLNSYLNGNGSHGGSALLGGQAEDGDSDAHDDGEKELHGGEGSDAEDWYPY